MPLSDCVLVYVRKKSISGRGHKVYYSTDMMTDEDKEATIKNRRGLIL